MDTSVEDLVSHLDDADLSELRRQYQAGGLAWLRPKLGAPRYHELGALLDSDDRHGVWALLIDRKLVAAPAWWAGDEERRRRGAIGWIGLIPLVIVLAIIALALGRCGSDKTTIDTGASAGSASATTSANGAEKSTGNGAAGAGSSTTTATTAATTTAKATTTTAAPTTTVATTTTANAAAANTLAAKLAADPQFSTLASLLTKAGVTDLLKGAGPFTIFAPTNAAFAALPPATLAALSANPEALKAVLTYHAVSGSFPASALVSGTKATLNGEVLTVAVADGVVNINSAKVTQADITGSNGVLHAVDQVLLPSNLKLGTAAQQKFSVFFDIGVATPNAASQPTVDQAFAAAKAAPAGTTVILTGFADVTGDPVSNLALSDERAKNVAATLAAGNPALGYLTNAKGDTEPGANADQSRRVDIVIG